MNQELISKGANGYIRTRDRREVLVRSLRPDGTTQITQLGRAFFRTRSREYVVHVPVTIRGRHKNGKDYDREDWLPVHKLGISGIMENEQYTEAQAHARVKSRVLGELGLRTQGGRTVGLRAQGGETVKSAARRTPTTETGNGRSPPCPPKRGAMAKPWWTWPSGSQIGRAHV